MTSARYCVIGNPIAHSKSPLIHNFWLKTLGMEAEYRACHVTPDALAADVDAVRARVGQHVPAVFLVYRAVASRNHQFRIRQHPAVAGRPADRQAGAGLDRPDGLDFGRDLVVAGDAERQRHRAGNQGRQRQAGWKARRL